MYGSIDPKTKGRSLNIDVSVESEPLVGGGAPPSSPPKQTSLRRRKPQPSKGKSKRQAALGRRQSARRKLETKASGPVFNKIFVEEEPSHIGDTERSSVGDHHAHSYVYSMLNPRSNRPQANVYKAFISTVIIVDLVFFVISTEPHLGKSMKHFLKIAEGVTSSIFLVEYVARLIVCTESRRYSKYGPVLGRLRYMVTPSAIIDALATFPFFIERLSNWDLPTLTWLRFFRLLRILKTQGFAKALDAVVRVVYYNREILYVALMVCIFLVLSTSVALYYLRPKNPVDAEDFRSLAATMYLSTLMLTGQGGPDGDMPWYTKMVVLVTAVFSVAMFAIPASMLTWGFEAEAARLAARARQRSKSRRKGRGGYSSTSSSSFSDDDDEDSLSTSDEEYQKIIAGEEGDDDSDDEKEQRAKLQAKFEQFDADDSGGLTMDEFIKLGMEPSSPDGSGGNNFHNRFGAAIASRSSALAARMDEMEEKVDETNEKLDRILQLLSDKPM